MTLFFLLAVLPRVANFGKLSGTYLPVASAKETHSACERYVDENSVEKIFSSLS